MDAVAKLKRDVESTLGAGYTDAVDTHARRLLPFDWPAHAFADRLTEGVQQEFHETFVDTTWPHCPAHPNHPLWFDDGVWRCNASGTAFAAFGDLGAMLFNDAIEGLRQGDFDRLAPLFRAPQGESCLILRWHADGSFAEHPAELAEALSCACFLGAPLETINMHGTTVLGTAVWSALHERRPEHLAIIETLLDAGAAVGASGYPSGDPDVDRLLERFGARQ